MLTTNRRAARACSLLMAVLLVITPNYQSSFVDQLIEKAPSLSMPKS